MVTFDEIEYTKAGTYIYTVVEEPGTDSAFNYDTATYQVVVVVTKDTAEKLHAEVSYYMEDGKRCDVLAFANTTKPVTSENVPKSTDETITSVPGTPVDDSMPLDDPNAPRGWRDGEAPDGHPLTDVPQTGDNTPASLWLFLLLCAGAAMSGVAYYSRRKYNC
jgi:pilin isopeptide linkage protein